MHKNSVFSSFIFKFVENFGNQAISFVINIFLARLLDPSDYGILTLLVIFINISRVFVQSGLNTALVQSKEVGEREYSSSFIFSLLTAFVVYIILFFSAPTLAVFFKTPQLTSVLRVLALILFPGAFSVVQYAIVSREMQFKALMVSSLLATIISGIIGLAMAYAGFAYWALVAQQLSSQIILTILLLFKLKWYPKAIFYFEGLKKLLAFGWKLLVSGVIDVVYENLRGFVIGKKYDNAALGFYNRGRQFPELVMNSVNGSIQSVLLPVLSSQQDDKGKTKDYMRKSLLLSTYFVFPLMMGLALVAKPLILVLLTDKWLPCVIFLQICCLDFALYPIHTTNLQAINAQGKSNIFLWVEIIKKTYGIVILLISIFWFKSVEAIVWGGAISSLISAYVNSAPNKKLVDYGPYEQFKDLLPNILLSIIMGVVVYFISFVSLPPILLLLIQIIVGMGVYALASYMLKVKSFDYLIQTIKAMRGN